MAQVQALGPHPWETRMELRPPWLLWVQGRAADEAGTRRDRAGTSARVYFMDSYCRPLLVASHYDSTSAS